jgi:hypothetical protein
LRRSQKANVLPDDEELQMGNEYEVRRYPKEMEEGQDGGDAGPETAVSQQPEEMEEKTDAGVDETGGTPSGGDEVAGTPGPTDELPGMDDSFPPGDDERAGTPTPEMPDAGTDSDQEGPQVNVDTNKGTVTFVSDHVLSPEEELAALESASDQFTDAAMAALHNLEEAEADGDAEEIADARAEFKKMAKGMTIVDQALLEKRP